jgi:predicted PurR-regulated permease PerM
VQRFDIDEYIERNQAEWQESLRNAGAPALSVARSVASGVFAAVTILVLTFLMVLQAPKLTRSALIAIGDRHRERVRMVAADCAKAVTGYMAGNLAISVIAGLSTFVFLTVIGVPFAGVLGLWVAFADLIPLVGATLGAIPTVGVAFLSSPGRGIAALIFYVVYQQLENHILQPTIMSRTVDINPLAVLVSVLAGVELFGLVGALLAIPAAGILQVIVRNLYDERRGRLKSEPSIGSDEVPMSRVEGGLGGSTGSERESA